MANTTELLTKLQATGPTTLPAARTLTLRDGRMAIATLTYHLMPGPYATLQILHIEVDESQRRRGHATRLVTLAIEDAQSLLGETKLRRVLTTVGHKSHLLYRALLSRLGFHHVSTTHGVLKGEDLLVYVKSYT